MVEQVTLNHLVGGSNPSRSTIYSPVLLNKRELEITTLKILLSTLLICLSSFAFANDMQFQFNSPSFNGSGYTAHVVGVYQLEQANKQKIKDNVSLAKAEEAAKAAADPINQFVMTLNSMVYQQLSQQVTNSIFGNGVEHGIITFGATTISWQKNLNGTVTVTTVTPNGRTELIVPNTTFVQ